MTVRIASITFDCADAHVLGRFWSAALGRPLDPKASSDFATIGFRGRRDQVGWAPVERDVDPTWMFVKVPEPKTAKNRLHLDLRVSGDGTPKQRWSCVMTEVARLGAAGAAMLHEFTGHHVVMADPEGNEFCLA